MLHFESILLGTSLAIAAGLAGDAMIDNVKETAKEMTAVRGMVKTHAPQKKQQPSKIEYHSSVEPPQEFQMSEQYIP